MENEEKDMIILLKTSPDDGMEQIMKMYVSQVKAICKHILFGKEQGVIEEVIQETFLKLWRHVESGKKINKSLKSFIYQIARNCAIDKLKEDKSICIDSLDEYGYESIESVVSQCGLNVHDEFIRRSNYKIIHEIIEEMNEPNKTIFVLKYFYNFKIREIASYLNLKEDNVESKERREKNRIKKILIERGYEYEQAK